MNEKTEELRDKKNKKLTVEKGHVNEDPPPHLLYPTQSLTLKENQPQEWIITLMDLWNMNPHSLITLEALHPGARAHREDSLDGGRRIKINLVRFFNFGFIV